jgi:hypothetical protein
MSEITALIRGEATLSTLRTALDALGVGHGEPFYLAAHEDTLGPKSRTADPNTSKQAAWENAPRRGTQRAKILRLLILDHKGDGSGLNRHEIQKYLPEIPIDSLSTRMSELKQGGWAYATGETRKTQHGVDAEVLAWTGKALDE